MSTAREKMTAHLATGTTAHLLAALDHADAHRHEGPHIQVLINAIVVEFEENRPELESLVGDYGYEMECLNDAWKADGHDGDHPEFIAWWALGMADQYRARIAAQEATR